MRCVPALLFAALLLATLAPRAFGQAAPPVSQAPAVEVVEETIEATVVEGEAGEKAAEEAPLSPDELAITKAVESYVSAFNKGDAKALASHFSVNGVLVPPEGETLRGRQKIEEQFVAYFKETQGSKIELVGAEVEFISPGVAIETGVALVVSAEGEPSETGYEAVHVKSAEGWKMDSVVEVEVAPEAPSHYEELQRLEWMIGTWSNPEDDERSVETTCRWTPHENFLVRTFKVYVDDEVDFEGTQVIGWDPRVKAIRSWTFDSDGGFAAGRWIEEEGRWTVPTVSVLPDGRQATSTNVYELLDDGTVRFSSVGRQVDGELVPSVEPVTVTRQLED